MPDHSQSSEIEAPDDEQPTADHHPTDPGQAAREQWHAGGGSALAPEELGNGPRADHAAPEAAPEDKNTPA